MFSIDYNGNLINLDHAQYIFVDGNENEQYQITILMPNVIGSRQYVLWYFDSKEEAQRCLQILYEKLKK